MAMGRDFVASDQDDVWIVVPAFNEAGKLGNTLSELRSRYRNVVVVDDGSTDSTADMVLRHDVWCLRHIANCGQGAALQTGIDFAFEAGATIIVTFDADGQHLVADIEPLIQAIRAGSADVALGSRFLGRAIGITWTRWAVLKIGVLVTRLISHLPLTDTHNGLRALNREAARRIRITQDRMAHASEIIDAIAQLGLRFVEVPVTVRYTPETFQKGQTSWNCVRIFGEILMARVIR